MLMSLRSRLSVIPRRLQYALVVLAGGASFLLSFGVGMHRQGSGSEPSIVAAKPMQAASATPTRHPSDSAKTASDSAVAASAAVPSRLNAGIVQNPFAPLNLQASMERPMAPPVVAPPPVRKPAPPPPPPPVPPPPVAQAVVAPSAPPLPFVVVGAIRGNGIAQGKPVVFLNEKGASLVVSEGDDIRGTYKVEKISDAAIEFTYLPLGQRQSLTLAR